MIKHATFKKEIKIPIYGGKFVMMLTSDPKEAQEYHSSITEEDFKKGNYALSILRSDDKFVMILNLNNSNCGVTCRSITHECIHLTNFLFQTRAVVTSQEHDEHFAYMAGWFAGEMSKFARDKGYNIL